VASEASAGHWKNPTIALSNVPTVDRFSKVQQSGYLYSESVYTKQEHSDATSFEKFYEFERFKKGDPRSNSQKSEYSGEDEVGSYESEDPSLSHVHVDTQYDDVTSDCRFVKGKKRSKRSKLSVNRSRKPTVLSNEDECVTN
jgi:hypothetical protein